MHVHVHAHVCVYKAKYRRSGIDYEILMIVNCEFFWKSQSKNRKVSLNIYGTGSTITVVRIAIWLD